METWERSLIRSMADMAARPTITTITRTSPVTVALLLLRATAALVTIPKVGKIMAQNP